MSDPFAAQRLDGKVLVVTGSTQGLGAAIARRAVSIGAEGIVICGRDGHRGEGVRGELTAAGCDAVFVEADLAEVESCRRVIAACEEHFGRLDGLVNAAGLSTRGTLDDTSVELWDRLFAVNVRAPFLLMQGAHRVRLLQGSAGDADPQCRLLTAARSHPRQRAEHRLDGDRGRTRRADD